MLSNTERQKWLDGLNVGDEVAVNIGRYGSDDYEIRKIERITKTRRFSLVRSSWEFNTDGIQRGKVDRWTPRLQIEPVTQQIRDTIRKRYVLARLDATKWNTMDLLKLERILAIIAE